jgi:hypothetical protein
MVENLALFADGLGRNRTRDLGSEKKKKKKKKSGTRLELPISAQENVARTTTPKMFGCTRAQSRGTPTIAGSIPAIFFFFFHGGLSEAVRQADFAHLHQPF